MPRPDADTIDFNRDIARRTPLSAHAIRALTALGYAAAVLIYLGFCLWLSRTLTGRWRPDFQRLASMPHIDDVLRWPTPAIDFPWLWVLIPWGVAALAVCSHLGCSDEPLGRGLPGAGRLERRFNVIRTRTGVTVIDDFAHNPAKIEAAMTAAQAMTSRLFALFQPHGYGPTRFMRDELIDTFVRVTRPADIVIILPIYFAGGTVTRDVSSADLVAQMCARGTRAFAPHDRNACIELLCREVAHGDLVLSMGARDPGLGEFAQRLVSELDGQTT